VPAPFEITRLLQKWSDGDRAALDQLMPIVYDELRTQAARYLRRERPDHTLQTTALVHEAYLRLVGQNEVHWNNRAHFFGIAATLMRRILVDHARAQQAARRGGSAIKLTLDAALDVPTDEPVADLLEIDKVLTKLETLDERQSRIVELRFFAGMSIEDTASVLRVAPATVKRDWQVAKAWIRRELHAEDTSR
jgi:RNA polymerase sigma-70 factor, ECF subfamily